MSKKNLSEQRPGISRANRQLNHNPLPVAAEGASLFNAAVAYLQSHSAYYRLTADDIKKMSAKPEGKFLDEKASFRFEAQKDFADIVTFVFVQTYFGLPVWEAGVSVSMHKKRKRILSSRSSAFDGIEVKPLNKDVLNKRIDAAEMYKALGLPKEGRKSEVVIQSERLLIYQYDAGKRTIAPIMTNRKEEALNEQEFVLPLPAVPAGIKDGDFYIVREVIFNYPLPTAPKLTWRAFVEPETGTVLYLRAFGSNVTGMVFERDPITKGSGLLPSASDADLNTIRDSIIFENLNPPAAGVQSLAGNLVSIQDVEAPTVAAPTEHSPYDFSYDARTNDFAAANTYYHCDGFLQSILNMGFGMSYFNGTVFPVPCDPRGFGGTGITINAHCLGNSTGITSVDFALADLSDTTDPLGIAADQRVVLHEIGGHGILYCHVGSANYGFSHSAGDSIAVITNDPGSQAPDRFDSFPFSFASFPASSKRRHDRTPADGWGWGGNIALHPFDYTLDLGGYNNEQILSSTLFRLYRSIGGDSTDLSMQQFASRFAVYLIVKAVSTLTPTTNPANALEFEQAMETGDASDWVSLAPAETQAGGAYMKVIRWAFEKQGLFQLPGAAMPNNNIGDAPLVDVYIDDGRHGEYEYQPNHWSCQDIWNRTTIGDGGGVHEDPIIGQTNYAYVRIKNRGSQPASNILVKGFHCFPGVGLVYPNDWMAMTTPELIAPNLAANDSVGVVVGPFEWVPSQIGHECLFFSVSALGNATDPATQDYSNIDGRVVGPIPEWRLVPNDNNIAQRNVAPVASSAAGLVSSFEDRPFWIRNSFDREVPVEVSIELPAVLERNKWKLILTSEGGQSFFLKQGERKKVTLKMLPGNNFDIKNEAANQQIQVVVKQDGIVVGGMVYYVDPNMKSPGNTNGNQDKGCLKDASALLKCLNLSDKGIRSVAIRKINIDIDFDDDCGC